MAITITKEPTGIYPASNDSYLQFTSSLAGDAYAEISFPSDSEFTAPFKVYPNSSGVYTFNLKNAVNMLLNADGFEDPSPAYPASYGKSFNYGYKSLDVDIDVYDGVGGSDSTSETYTFIRGAKQVGESVFSNTGQILNYSTNGVDYNISYWEGFPLTFEIQRVTSGHRVMFTNLNTGDDSTVLTATATGSYRMYVDKVSSNWTSSNFLPLPDVINRLELYVSSSNPPTTFRSNVNIHKHLERCGVYLKWFNADGGYSYYLFDNFYRYAIQGQNVGYVGRNEFLNLEDGIKNPIRSIGKAATETWTLKARADREEVKLLRSLFTSPSVQMWSEIEPYIDGEWIDVTLNSTMNISTKKSISEIAVSIELPELITSKL